ncbi:MAG TPA: hypothetical protein VK447_18230 [Myxococcaceae bacterium]|nr:hypothetical protein [Myxococcaceae bacterium]
MKGIERTLSVLLLGWAIEGHAQSSPPIPPRPDLRAVLDVVCKYDGGSRRMQTPVVDGYREEIPRFERYIIARTQFGTEQVTFADVKKLVFIRPLKLDKDGYVKAMLTPREGKERKVDVLVRKDGRALMLISRGTDAPHFRLVDCLELEFLQHPRPAEQQPRP